ncbi:MAG: DUF3108 domain-containing protein, partial [bacterium]|nr:DUF3108 domain-containing protein [bacterium]
MMIKFKILPALLVLLAILFASKASISVTPALTEDSTTKLTRSDEAGKLNIGETFVGEEYTYTIGFWILNDVAEGTIKLTRDAEGQYVATLSAHTTGAIGRLFRKRKDSYTTRLKIINDGNRFITGRLEKNVRIGKKTRRSVQELNYETGKLNWTTYKKGKVRYTGEMDIPPGEKYDGPLTAFYNLRHGAYGPI